MALLGTANKQPGEVIDYDISFTNFLANRSDTLNTVVSVSSVPAELVVLYSTINVDIVKVVISGGVDGQVYKVTTTTTTTGGLSLEDEVTVMVTEV